MVTTLEKLNVISYNTDMFIDKILFTLRQNGLAIQISVGDLFDFYLSRFAGHFIELHTDDHGIFPRMADISFRMTATFLSSRRFGGGRSCTGMFE